MVRSTRSNRFVDLETALLQGLADDGGLFVFEDLDTTFFSNAIKDTSIKTYPEWAECVLGYFFPNWTQTTIKNISQKAYRQFEPARAIVDDFDNFAYLELFHGPTFSFKDMALQALPYLIEESKRVQNNTKKTFILTATSGDTGSAALAGYQAFDDATMIVLYPEKGVSPFQAHQMNAMQDASHVVYGIDGHFDDAQDIVKEAFKYVDRSRVHVTSANSINIGRLILQMVYYFYSYMQLVQKKRIHLNETINVVVPSGNFGNVLSAYYAKKLGLPIHKCIVSSNQNNVLTTFFKTGDYTVKSILNSFSPSMDISLPSNLERYLFDLFDQDETVLKRQMTHLKNKGRLTCKAVLKQSDFYANYASEEETLKTINKVYKTSKKIIDPHTAVAKCVYEKYVNETQDDHYSLIVSTASPYKFAPSVLKALNKNSPETIKGRMAALKTIDHSSQDERLTQLLEQASTAKTCLKNEALKKVVEIIEKQAS